MNLGSLEGRASVVTGASSGIGREVARSLAAEGAIVAAIARSRESLNELAAVGNGRIYPYPCDVCDEVQVQRAFDEIVDRHGVPTILIANAGLAKFGSTLDSTLDDWLSHINTNLTGVYLCNIAAIRGMLRSGGGDIINVLSVAAVVGLPGSAAYSASKAGALGLTRSLNAEFRTQGIRITALMPGATDTPLWQDDLQNERDRMMKAQDVAQTLVWILKTPATASVDEVRLMPREGLLP